MWKNFKATGLVSEMCMCCKFDRSWWQCVNASLNNILFDVQLVISCGDIVREQGMSTCPSGAFVLSGGLAFEPVLSCVDK